MWSSNGSYLVELMEFGFYIYGGPKFEKLGFYPHMKVKKIEFSPNEEYILSFNGTSSEVASTENYKVWILAEFECVKSFKAMREDVWGTF